MLLLLKLFQELLECIFLLIQCLSHFDLIFIEHFYDVLNLFLCLHESLVVFRKESFSPIFFWISAIRTCFTLWRILRSIRLTLALIPLMIDMGRGSNNIFLKLLIDLRWIPLFMGCVCCRLLLLLFFLFLMVLHLLQQVIRALGY